MKNTLQANKVITQKLKPSSVSAKGADLYRSSMDNLRLSRLPSLFLKPANEEELEKILETANHYKIPITTRGAGSATTGSATPLKDAWVIDLSSWNSIHVDPVSRMAYAQPGATIEAIDEAASKHGLMYPPDPGSKEFATIGGSIATNAGGLRGAKYGVTRDYVLSLEGYLPTGQFVRWGADLRKFSAGFNIRDLWIGSEGMLGIITGCVLRLIPRPLTKKTAVLSFENEEIAIAAIQSILKSKVTPSVLEFLDIQTIACTVSFWQRIAPEKLISLPTPLRKQLESKNPPAIVLLEIDGDSITSTNTQLRTIRKSISEQKHKLFLANDDATTTQLWSIRKSCSQAMFEFANTKINEDIVIPLDRYYDLLEFTKKLKNKTGLATPTFGHVADGNFHVHVMYDRYSPTEKVKAKKAIDSLMKKITDWGGVISGEHGIGLAKSSFLPLQYEPAEIDLMKRIKSCFDPNNILNPDKLFTPFSPWDHPREEIKMPWDH